MTLLWYYDESGGWSKLGCKFSFATQKQSENIQWTWKMEHQSRWKNVILKYGGEILACIWTYVKHTRWSSPERTFSIMVGKRWNDNVLTVIELCHGMVKVFVMVMVRFFQ